MPKLTRAQAASAELEFRRRQRARLEFPKKFAIPTDLTFLDWCEQLGRDGLLVDGHPFTLESRPAMRFLYGLIPSTPEEAFGRILAVMKGAQVGATVWEMLADIYMALKWEPCKIGLYVPDMKLAGVKSTERFMPIVRSVPHAYTMLTGGKANEGNVLTRTMGRSAFYFLWTSGKMMTESLPMDVLSFDEVQGMLVEDMEKTRERLSASRIKYTAMLSTAKWPDSDIDYWFQRGKRYRFHTACGCEDGVVLDEVFPACVQWHTSREEFAYRCPVCDQWIEDTQAGHWDAEAPEARIDSLHLPQTLSATVTADEVMEAFKNARDLQNFYNRKLGKPYADPSQIPVSLDILEDCARLGQELGVVWKEHAADTYMGIDQMGAYNVVIIKERLPSGHQATIHVEEIYSDDPFARCDTLMAVYGVAVCVVEQLPNYNDAKRFANRHPGRVFLASYAKMEDDMMRWGDASFTKADRKTDESERDRYTVTLDQYKVMQVAMQRIVKRQAVFPDPDGLIQSIRIKGSANTEPVAVLRKHVFLHLTKVALVVEEDPDTRKKCRSVQKVGIDPHFAYANMLCDVAWARSHGVASFIIPGARGETMSGARKNVEASMKGLPPGVLEMLNDLPAGEVCGRCASYDPEISRCIERGFAVRPADPGCVVFVQEAE